MINNRQSGRRRGRGGGGNGPRPQGGGGGRPDNGNRIDNRARGNAAQLLEKYRNLAADAQRQGDRVNTEYYLQFADHYFRVLSETRARQEEAQGHQAQQRRPVPADPYRDQFEDEEGDEFGEEGDAIRPGEMMAAPERQPQAERPERGQNERGQGERGQNERQGERRYGDRGQNERQYGDRAQGERAQGERGQGDREGYRADGVRPREDRQRRQPREEAAPLPPPAGPGAEMSAEATEPAAPMVEAPRRRGRPPRRVAEAAAPSEETGGVEGLPPAIGAAASDAPERTDQAMPGDEAPKPRRRRLPRAAEASAAE